MSGVSFVVKSVPMISKNRFRSRSAIPDSVNRLVSPPNVPSPVALNVALSASVFSFSNSRRPSVTDSAVTEEEVPLAV
jgi:hypothetical protein